MIDKLLRNPDLIDYVNWFGRKNVLLNFDGKVKQLYERYLKAKMKNDETGANIFLAQMDYTFRLMKIMKYDNKCIEIYSGIKSDLEKIMDGS